MGEEQAASLLFHLPRKFFLSCWVASCWNSFRWCRILAKHKSWTMMPVAASASKAAEVSGVLVRKALPGWLQGRHNPVGPICLYLRLKFYSTWVRFFDLSKLELSWTQVILSQYWTSKRASKLAKSKPNQSICYTLVIVCKITKY